MSVLKRCPGFIFARSSRANVISMITMCDYSIKDVLDASVIFFASGTMQNFIWEGLQ